MINGREKHVKNKFSSPFLNLFNRLADEVARFSADLTAHRKREFARRPVRGLLMGVRQTFFCFNLTREVRVRKKKEKNGLSTFICILSRSTETLISKIASSWLRALARALFRVAGYAIRAVVRDATGPLSASTFPRRRSDRGPVSYTRSSDSPVAP